MKKILTWNHNIGRHVACMDKWQVKKLKSKNKKLKAIQEEINMDSIESIKNLTNVLETSARLAREVMNRECIVAERAVRVGEFVTILRRELQVNSGWQLAQALTSKSVWYDILVLNKNPDWDVRQNLLVINTAIAEALRRLNTTKTTGVERDLCDIESLIHDNIYLVDKSNELLDKADEVTNGIEIFANKIIKQNEENHYGKLY